MIIWSGYGFLVAIVVFVSSLVMNLLTDAITGNENFYGQANLPFTTSLILSGIICWFLGRYLNKPGEKTLVDKESGEEVVLSSARHRLFFIKMEYWGPILAVLGIINLFQ